MLHIKEAVIVEGKYDKIKLSRFIDAEIITTDGFGIFRDKAKGAMIRRIAEKRGVIIITDSDSAGFLIRGHLNGLIPEQYITNVYIPEIKGKEKRKTAPSAEGLLGVEGMSEQIVAAALQKSGIGTAECPLEKITHSDLYALGLSGTHDSREKRAALLRSLDLPSGMSKSQFLSALNALYSREEFIKRYGKDEQCAPQSGQDENFKGSGAAENPE